MLIDYQQRFILNQILLHFNMFESAQAKNMKQNNRAVLKPVSVCILEYNKPK